jgi:hypothetical protein
MFCAHVADSRGQRMSIGLERVKLQAALALEAANESKQ